MSNSKNVVEKLRTENKLLRKMLGLSAEETITDISDKVINHKSPTDDKINLFQSLFKGRRDVFAERWENQQGKSGYSPVCKNRWNKSKCGLPDVKCSDCPNKKYIPITNDVIFNHLSGKTILGLYPLKTDNTCNFLAIDFDEKSWKDDVLAIKQTCDQLSVPAYIEISRSGNGTHLWLFFEKPMKAIRARVLGSFLILRTLQSGEMLDLKSYDRMFPSQDTLAEGGLGNLIALPLQKSARERGFSLFVNDDFEPYPDQWAYLSLIKKTTDEEIVKALDSQAPISQIDTAIGTPVNIVFANQIFVSKLGLPKSFYYSLIQLATFPNPEFFIAQASRRTTHNIPKLIDCSSNYPNSIALPSGLLPMVVALLTKHKIVYDLHDKRNMGNEIAVQFKGTLLKNQQDAIDSIISKEMCVLSASTGFGKTIIAIKAIEARQVNTLILVHRAEILDQWVEKLKIFTNVSDIGIIGKSKNNPTLVIDVAMLQSLRNKPISDIDRYGQIIVDECHHIAAYSFESILKKSSAKYILGLTATPKRKDGLHPIINMQCGETVYKSVAHFDFMPMYAIIKEIKSDTPESPLSFPKLLNYLAKLEYRNNIIFNDVIDALEQKRKPIVLTERIEHLTILEEMFTGMCKNLIVIKGGMGKKQRTKMKELLNSIPDDEERLIIASGKYIGEGFDYPILDTLFLTLPISWKGTLQQYIGRIMRNHRDKDSIEVYDYVDVGLPRLVSMYQKRRRAYSNLGFTLEQE